VPPGYFFNRPCGNQMGTKFWEMVCDESATGGSGEYCGDSDAHLGRISVFYHEAFGGKYVPCAMLFGLGPGVVGAVTLSCRSASSSARVHREAYAREKTLTKATAKGSSANSSDPPPPV
jgi:hypothetical protein